MTLNNFFLYIFLVLILYSPLFAQSISFVKSDSSDLKKSNCHLIYELDSNFISKRVTTINNGYDSSWQLAQCKRHVRELITDKLIEISTIIHKHETTGKILTTDQTSEIIEGDTLKKSYTRTRLTHCQNESPTYVAYNSTDKKNWILVDSQRINTITGFPDVHYYNSPFTIGNSLIESSYIIDSVLVNSKNGNITEYSSQIFENKLTSLVETTYDKRRKIRLYEKHSRIFNPSVSETYFTYDSLDRQISEIHYSINTLGVRIPTTKWEYIRQYSQSSMLLINKFSEWRSNLKDWLETSRTEIRTSENGRLCHTKSFSYNESADCMELSATTYQIYNCE